MLLNEKFIKPIGFNTWNTYLQKELTKCETVYYFIFNYLSENKLKVFRWKLLHFIIPTKKLLLKWKIMKNSLCNLCSLVEVRVITKLPNSEQSYKGKVKTHNYINRQNQSTTGKL